MKNVMLKSYILSFVILVVATPAFAVRTLKQSTAYNLMVFMTDATDHVTGKTGLTLSVTASKDGGTFASISPTVTERGNGWYNLALTTSHTDTLGDLAIRCMATGADPTDMIVQVRANVLGDTLPANVTQLNGAAQSLLDLKDFADAGYDPVGNAVTLVYDVDATAEAGVVSEIAPGGITAGSFGAGAIDASAIATGAIGNDEFNVTENLNANLVAILGTTFTEGAAGRIASAFDNFFDQASPTGHVNSLPSAAPGAANGLFIAGTNAPVTISTTSGSALTISSTGNDDAVSITSTGLSDGISVNGGLAGVRIQGGFGLVVTGSSGHGATFTGAGTGHGALFTSGTGATGNGIQATAASTDGNGFGLSGAGTGQAISGQLVAGNFAAGAIGAAAIADAALDRATFAADTGLQSIRSATAQAGAAGSITLDASASSTTDFYKHGYAYITGGAGVGQYRLITGYNGTSKAATVTPAWTTGQEPNNTSTFAVLPAGIANVEAWLGTPAVAPTVPGLPEVDITHVLGSPVCD